MCKTLLSLDPLADATVWTSINAAMAVARSTDQRDDDRSWDQLQADVVVDLLIGARAAGRDRRAPEVTVLVDEGTLRAGFHDRSTCETSDGQQLPVATVRRLCCDGDVFPVVLGGDGEVLDVGRQQRLATRAQRRALRAMYRSCAHPQCRVPFDACRIHHVIYWERGGRTNLANMVPLCERHHHLVHEGGWTLELFADRRTVWRTPDGTVYHDGTTTDRVAREANCVRSAHHGRLTSAAEVADELQLALATITSRAPP
jgi:5-methylcytosine-specific restriction endonuclease McrA